MVHPKHWLKLLCFALTFSLLVACDQGSTPGSSVSAEMEDTVGWFMANLPANYWANEPRPSAVIDLYVSFKDANIAVTDLESVKITNSLSPEVSWSLPSAQLGDYFYTSQSTGKKRLAINNIWSSQIAANGSVIYLGVYTVEVTLKNGKRSSKTLTTPAPNSLTASGYQYAYSSEDYVGTPPGDYVALPKRATIESATRNAAGDALAINFSVNDDKIYSGWILFLDAKGDYLGYAGDFRNFETEAAYAKLNNGQGLFTNGTGNLLALTTADIQVSSEVSNFTLSMIKDFRIILTDGKQYIGTDSFYDTYSLSIGTIQ